jgi:DNA primase
MQRHDIDALLDRVDLTVLAGQAGANLYQHRNEWRGACPLHAGRDESAFVIFNGDDGRQIWHCFSGGCGSGDALSFVMKWRGLSFLDAVRYLGGEPVSAEDEARIAIARAERAAKMAEQAAAQAREAVAALKSTELWKKYHDEMNEDARRMWDERGIGEDWQNIWSLGYCRRKGYMTKMGELFTPSMTIPLFTHGWDVVNVKHRLLNPLNPKDKYRPEKSGLSMPAYICDPDMPKDKTENVLIVEGEIKAMVSYITLDSPKWQVIGLPGKDAKKIKNELINDYAGRNCFVCLDPDGKEQARELAAGLGGRMFTLPQKIDDIITAGGIDKETLRGLIRQAEKVVL